MAGTDPLTRLKEKIRKYTGRDTVPDIARYRRIRGVKAGRCIFTGCTEPIAWEDAQGGNFLCEGHYLTVRRWVEEARAGYL
ncbi:MAG: hypothetical protein LUQ64_00085 [Methanomicrobiales archaeon]|nr:hypothetical protein [Methanomicrobiales archaeon]